MTTEHSPQAGSAGSPDLVEKPAVPSVLDPAAEEVVDSQAKSISLLPNGKSSFPHDLSAAETDSSLHSLTNGGLEESEQKSESPVQLSDEKLEAPPPSPEPSESGKVIPEEQTLSTDSSTLPLEGKSEAAETAPVADEGIKLEPSAALSGEEPAPVSLGTSSNTESSPSLEELPSLPPTTQEETSASANSGQADETIPEKEPGIIQDSLNTLEELPAESQPPLSASIHGDVETSANTGQTEERSIPTAEQAPDIAPDNEPPIENPDLLTGLPTAKKSTFKSLTLRRLKDEELKSRVLIPNYLAKGFVNAIESAGVAYNEGPRINVQAPEQPLLVFINSKSGGRLGPQLEAFLVDLIAPAQVYDLSKCKPADVLRYGLGFLEKEADAGDNAALETRNNIRIMVAGGDGTVGWVLGSIGELELKGRFKVPPVGVIPLGTGNDLSRSFRWGGSTTSVSRNDVKKWLTRATEAEVATLDSWQVVVKPAPTCTDVKLELPHAMHPQHHIPLKNAGSEKEAVDAAPYFEGSFWNYFSLGMDAQVAYGFHHLRDEAPWIASGRLSNQMVYGGYSCVQGWFCTPCATVPVARGIKQIAKVFIQRNGGDGQWEQLDLPADIRAIVILNLQSYAGGRNPWGRPSSNRREKEGFVEAKCNDGVLEIVGFVDGWHTAFVLLDWFTAVRLGQARGVRFELTGMAHRSKAYMQMDGEPWQQPLGAEGDLPAVVEISYNPTHSVCLSRK